MSDNNATMDLIWNECKSYLIKLCEYKLQGCNYDTDDVLSDIAVAFYKAMKSDKPPEKPKAWLFATANNIINKKYRKKKDEKKVISFSEFEYETKELAVYPDFDEEIISDKDILRMSTDILNDLDEEEKFILNSFHEEKMTFAEIGVLLGKSESAVKQKHYRLCIKIRARVKKCIENP